MSKTKTLVDLTPFCYIPHEPCVLFLLTVPFTEGDYTYATDGAIIVRVPKRPGFEKKQGARYPKVERVGTFTAPGRLRKCPAVKGPPLGVDPWWMECNISEDGEDEWPEVIDAAVERIVIRDEFFGRRYVWLISQLPGVKIANCRVASDPGLYFQFDGGSGYVKALRK
jgi:hypothetical protein